MLLSYAFKDAYTHFTKCVEQDCMSMIYPEYDLFSRKQILLWVIIMIFNLSLNKSNYSV